MISRTREEVAVRYALGLLRGPESARFVEQARRRPELRVLVQELQDAAASLAWVPPQLAPPPALREQILGAVHAAPLAASPKRRFSARRLPRWVPWTVAGALALLAGWLALDRLEMRRDIRSLQFQDVMVRGNLAAAGDRDASSRAEAAAEQSRDQLSNLRLAVLISVAAQTPELRGAVAWDPVGQRGVVTIQGAPALAPAEKLVLWVIDPHFPQPVSCGVIPSGQIGPASSIFTAAEPIHSPDQFAVSREQDVSSIRAPKGPIILRGE